MLKGKNAVIYGAGGSLGGAVSIALSKAGAHVFLTGKNLDSVRKTKATIEAAGGTADIEEVDALNESAVNEHLKKLDTSVDISFNAIGMEDRQNILLAEMTLEDFIRPVRIAMTTQFITATAAARKMIEQKSGVILSLTATPGGIGYAKVGGFGPACCAMESFSRDLASELGVHGIRVVNIRSGGSPDSRVFREAIEQGGEAVEGFINKMKEDTMLKEMPLMKDIAGIAVFLASDMAAAITGVTIDATMGTTAALNYKMTDVAFLEQKQTIKK